MALSVSWCSDWRYLVRHAEEGVSERDRRRDDNYYLRAAEHGEPAGRWLGRGAVGLGLTGEVQRSQMELVYGKMIDPATGEQLGSTPRTYASADERLAKLLAAEPDATPERRALLVIEARKSTREARHYADLTYSPPKSWSVLHAALEREGRHAEADAVWSACMTGVEASLDYLQAEAGYSRAGYHGAVVAGRSSGRWVDGHDWVMSAWRHHTSRDGEPQLHVHVAVLNRVLNADGTWRSLDSSAVKRVRPAAEALAHRVAEQALTRSLGVRFATRPDGAAREIVGIDADTRDLFSSRRRAIRGIVGDLAQAYEERHGAAPRAYQLTLMAEHATLVSRARKPKHPPGRAALLESWERKTVARHGRTLAKVLDQVKMHPKAAREAAELFDPDQVIAQALAQVDRSKTVWTRHDLIGQLDRYLPDTLAGLDASASRRLLDELADRALATSSVVCLTAPEVVAVPPQLRRADGYSLYEPHRSERYATTAELTREERLVKMAHGRGGRRLDDVSVNRYLATESTLSPEQAGVARAVLTSDRRVEVLVGPAGTGKSHTIGEIARLWEDHGGKVIGVTVAESAARVLADEGIDRAANVARFLRVQDDIAAGRAGRGDRRDFTLTASSLLVLDEASMISTPELARLVELAHGAGAKVLITGDDRQLGAVGVGGGMRLVVREIGAHELAEVRRFEADWEGPASLRLRDGDVAALDDYDRRGRLVEGDASTAKEAAYGGFLADHVAGKQSLLVTSNNEAAAELASCVRADLVDLGRVEEGGAILRSGTLAGRGDLIQTRRNDRTLTDAGGRPVVNRDVYLVTDRSGDILKVRRQLEGDRGWGPELQLPASYVRAHVELAYASTAHAAQGRTVDTAHVVVDDQTSRSGLYVGLSRGRQSNVAYVVTAAEVEDGREPVQSDRFAVLSSIMERDDADRSATEVLADELHASESLARLGPIWADCLAEDARRRYEDTLTQVLGRKRAAAVRTDEAAGPLWRLVRSAELDGHDPRRLLETVVARRELDTAESIAQVLHHRLEREVGATAHETRSTSVLRTFTERTPERQGLDPGGMYEGHAAHARRLAVVMDRRREELGEQAAREQPPWATDLGPVPEDPLDRTDWTERAASVAAYREQYGQKSPTDPIGPAPPRAGDPDRRVAWDQAWTALGRPERDRDVARRSDGDLANLVEIYRREEAWAPPYVGDELREAHLSERYWTHQAAMEEAGRPAPTNDAGEATRLGARQIAHDMAERRARLDEIDSARRAWYEHTEQTRQVAQRAAGELARRHPESVAEHAPITEPAFGRRRRSSDHDRSVQRASLQVRAAADHLRDESLSRALDQAREARRVIAERLEQARQEAVFADEYVQRIRSEEAIDRLRQLERGPSLGF